MRHYWKWTVIIVLFAQVILTSNLPNRSSAVIAQTPERPMILPMEDPPSMSTWLLGQSYGNTTGAYRFGQEWYAAGQGLHFGLDLRMQCGTRLVAAADGEVLFVDNLAHGAGPHNLLISHPQLNVVTLYGHLLEAPDLFPGQSVQQGEFVALSGDPDSTCDSRPHLHFEVRSMNRGTAYNPVNYIDANWHMLASFGSFGYPLFQQDMANPRRWISIDDQPDVVFQGRILNNYVTSHPVTLGGQNVNNAPLDRDLDPLPDNSEWSLRQVGVPGCCGRFWWHPTDPEALYVMDGSNGNGTAIQIWDIFNGVPIGVDSQGPPLPRSSDGTYEIRTNGGGYSIVNLQDNSEHFVQTNGGAVPSISPDNSRLVWISRDGQFIPGGTPPPIVIWTSDFQRSVVEKVMDQRGGGARWLDNRRILVSSEGEIPQTTTLSVYDTIDKSSFTLGTWEQIRAISVAPGGERIMFYIALATNPNLNGVYVLNVQPGATAQRLPWVGTWQWRDKDSVYYLPFEPDSSRHSLAYYELDTGEHHLLTNPDGLPFTVANGEWDVSADGTRIAFQSADDMTLWLLELEE